MIQINKLFIKAFSPNEQLVMLQLLLNADSNGIVEFSDRGISKATNIPYQQVRTIHQRWLADGTLTNAPANACNNANRVHVIICDYESYNTINFFSNAVTNAVTNALKEKETITEKDKVFPQTPIPTEKENNKEKEEIEIEADASSSSENDAAKKDVFDYDCFCAFFNKTLEEQDSRIPRIKKLDSRRKNMIHARIKDYGVDAIYEVTQKVASNRFLNGGGSKGWVAKFDWIFGPDNFRKVIEGNYDDENKHHEPKVEQSKIDWE